MSAIEFKFDGKELTKAIKKGKTLSKTNVGKAMHDIKDDWQSKAVDSAPLDSGHLRTQIQGKVKGSGFASVITTTGNASDNSGFNYGLYIHEYNAGGRNVSGEKKFIEKPLKDNEDKYAKLIEEAIKSSFGSLLR